MANVANVVSATAAGSWNPETAPVNKARWQSVWTPGVCRIVGAHAPREIQVSKGPGFSGALYLFRGLAVVKFKIEFYLYDAQDWADWHAFKANVAIKTLKSAANPAAAQALVVNPATIWHPYLADPTIDINSIVVDDVYQPEDVDEYGTRKIVLDVYGYRKLKVSSAKYEEPKDEPLDAQDRRNLAKAADNDAKRSALAAIRNQKPPAPKP